MVSNDLRPILKMNLTYIAVYIDNHGFPNAAMTILLNSSKLYAVYKRHSDTTNFAVI